MRSPYLLSALALTACGSTSASHPSTPTSVPTALPAAASPTSQVSAIPLPGASADGVFMDYLLFDPRTNTVWVPAGNTGAVDVIDVATGSMRRIEGFATQELERRGKKRVVGPSSATLGMRGTVYIGNRGDFSICAIDEDQLAKRSCGRLDAMPDGIAYVDKTQEVWVTTPRDKSIRILDAATLVQKTRLTFDGEPEGFAPDATRGRFYTNLEDKDVTLAIDLSSHETVATWKPNCGEEGPHGLRLDEAQGVLVVACSAKVETLDVAHEGAILATFATGDGVDDIDYSARAHEIYVGAAKTGNLTIARLGDHGSLAPVASIVTKEGARNGVVAGNGSVYLAHSKASELVVVGGLPPLPPITEKPAIAEPIPTGAASPAPSDKKALMRQFRDEREKRVRDRGEIFARIATKHDYTGEYVLYRDKDVTAFLDLKDPRHPRYSPEPGHEDSKRRSHILVVPNQPRETIGKTIASDITAEDLEVTLKVMRAAAGVAKRLGIKDPKIFVKSPERVGVGYLHVHVVGERDPDAPYPPPLK